MLGKLLPLVVGLVANWLNKPKSKAEPPKSTKAFDAKKQWVEQKRKLQH